MTPQNARHRSIALIVAASIVLVGGSWAYGWQPNRVSSTGSLPRTAERQAWVLQVASARSLPKGMTREEQASVAKVVKNLRAGDTQAARNEWGSLVTSMSKRNASPIDVEMVIQLVIRESYLQSSELLHDYADKVRFFNEEKRALSDNLRQLRAARSQATAHSINVSLITKLPAFNAADRGRAPVLALEQRSVMPEALDPEIKKLEDQLNTIGDDAELANVDLQNVLQKQQQTLQLMSNISKTLHDMSMAIIRKTSG